MNSEKDPATIGRAARRAGVSVETIRFYERRGLIEKPLKPETGGFRMYDAETIRRIRFIREAKEIGFSLREIAELLSLRADPGADCADIRDRAVTKRAEVEDKIARLGQMRQALDVLIARCPGRGNLDACSILDAMEHSKAAAGPSSPAARDHRGRQASPSRSAKG